jgi:hypothetical protein
MSTFIKDLPDQSSFQSTTLLHGTHEDETGSTFTLSDVFGTGGCVPSEPEVACFGVGGRVPSESEAACFGAGGRVPSDSEAAKGTRI